jgi:hypothetical protein
LRYDLFAGILKIWASDRLSTACWKGAKYGIIDESGRFSA